MAVDFVDPADKLSQGDLLASAPSVYVRSLSYLVQTAKNVFRLDRKLPDSVKADQVAQANVREVVEGEGEDAFGNAVGARRFGLVLSHDCELDKPGRRRSVLVALIRPLSVVQDDERRNDIRNYAAKRAFFGDGSREDYRRALGLDEDGKPSGEGAVAFFGHMRLAAIAPQDVREYAARLAARGLAASSVRKNVAPLRALFATAVEDGAIRSNPAAGLRIANVAADEEVDEVKALTEDELHRVVEKLPVAWRFFFEFLAQTGLRIGEAIELRWADVDGGRLRVCRRYYRGAVGLPKGRKKRAVPLSRDLAQALWARRKELHAKADDLVFTSAKGLRIDPSNLMDRVLKPAARAADVGDWVTFHTFRHTCATMLFRGRWNTKTKAYEGG